MSSGVISDPAVTAGRLAELAAYMDTNVLGPHGFCCSTAQLCRASSAALPEATDFSPGQLSHLGAHYDLQVAGAPLRVLVIAMETGRPGHHVTLARRYHQVVEESGNTAPDRRNPHMVGTTLALRTIHGLPLDPAMRHDLVDVGPGAPVHLFDTLRWPTSGCAARP